jgi:hypothetical protein
MLVRDEELIVLHAAGQSGTSLLNSPDYTR